MGAVELRPGVRFDNAAPFVLIGGMTVIEGRDMLLRVAEQLAGVTQRLGIPHLFEASFDKASRSSLGSFRGPGIFDVTRALQRPGGRADSADGRGGQALRDLEAFLARVQAVDRAVKG